MVEKLGSKSAVVALEPSEQRAAANPRAMAQAVLDHLYYVRGRIPAMASLNDWYQALAYTVRDRILRRWVETVTMLRSSSTKAVAYLSAEFLLGPHLGNNLNSLGLTETAREAMRVHGQSLDEILEHEEEPGLGNGGLGRLAACYLESMATVGVPAIAYGIRYEFGIFDQEIRDGWQVEITDKWLQYGNPWEIVRPDVSYEVKLGGYTRAETDGNGSYRVHWEPDRVVKGVAYDTAILGYHAERANLLRLWKAEACESFDFQAFNVGDYYRAVDKKVASENITKVLYPNDEPVGGKRLRLEQQYFFVSCSLQDVLHLLDANDGTIERLPERVAAQLNDTHPSIGVAEMMRLLVDERGMEWEKAWDFTQRTFGYTNHTLLPEALETWSLPLFGSVLPRHLEIIYEINRRFLDEVRLRFPGDEERVARMSLIDENGEKAVRMAHLATVGSHAVNGVAELHTKLLAQSVLRDFYEMSPEKFHNVTNGVTPRRWLLLTNPELSDLITETLGAGWPYDLEHTLYALEPLAQDAGFRDRWRAVKQANKRRLAAFLAAKTHVPIDPESMFDIQVKRIHEYKRQHLNVLHLVSLYQRIKREPKRDVVPRTVVFGGKAAPGYFMAKLIIKLINSVAEVVNSDPDVAGRLKVVFLPDFNVKVAHHVYPAADLSEQISTAGKEASGTGNMKFALNGALTIGTLDGANVEIREKVGEENFFLFGLTAEEVVERRRCGYQPRACYESNEDLRQAIDMIASGHFSPGDKGLFAPLLDGLLNWDEYFVLADYAPYVESQDRVDQTWSDRDRWTVMSILNVARSGYFSSDRSIREYSSRIWNTRPVPPEGTSAGSSAKPRPGPR